jgi:ParB family transcriptional regulator, chromosome partitioning protein
MAQRFLGSRPGTFPGLHMQKKTALGRGLGDLIHAPPVRRQEAAPATSSPAPAPGEVVRKVALDAVVPSPLQPRKNLREETLSDLVDSIREHGVIQPLIVREVNGRYELIAGERRWRACTRLGLPEIPIIVRTASDRDVLEMALIENLQREDLNAIEEAEAYARLAREFSLKQEEIAQRVGKNRATVANAIRLLDLTADVKDLLAGGQLSVGHAKVLLSLKDAELQNAAATQIIRRGLTVRATEQLVSDASKQGKVPADSAGATGTPARKTASGRSSGTPEIRDLEEKLRERYATKVTIHHGEKKGRVEIEYYGNTDLDRILALMGHTSRYDML